MCALVDGQHVDDLILTYNTCLSDCLDKHAPCRIRGMTLRSMELEGRGERVRMCGEEHSLKYKYIAKYTSKLATTALQ